MRFRSTIATLCAAALISPLAAQQYTKDYSDRLPEDLPEFEEADRNDDSLIDWEEAQAAGVPREVFEAEQQDGFVSQPTWDYIFLRKDP
jgi:hypothetical protein